MGNDDAPLSYGECVLKIPSDITPDKTWSALIITEENTVGAPKLLVLAKQTYPPWDARILGERMELTSSVFIPCKSCCDLSRFLILTRHLPPLISVPLKRVMRIVMQ